ncbi:prepilin peptidase, partial [Turicibacter sanguinis]
EALGGGDIKLYAVVGFVLGIAPTFLSIFIASGIALIYILLFMKDKAKVIGFGPFIAMASYICLFYGQSLLDWYFNLF